MKRTNYYSYLRAIACMAIVLLHTADASVMLYGDAISNVQKTVSMGMVYCMMWAVPTFVMVTGALLLNPEKEITYKKLYGKYILRIVLALAVFGLIFRCFDILMNGEIWSVTNVLQGLWNVVIGKSWAHLWYLYLLIGIYLLLPFYRKIAANSSTREIWYLLGIYALFISILPLTGMVNVDLAFYIHTSTIYPFYLFLGWTISSGKLNISRMGGAILFVVGTLLLITVVRYRYLNGVEELAKLLNYSSVFVILQCMGLFALLKREQSSEDKGSFGTKILLSIDKCSFGIYLVHMIFIRLVLRYWEVNPYASGTWMILVLSIGIFLLSWILVRILKFIPICNKIL